MNSILYDMFMFIFFLSISMTVFVLDYVFQLVLFLSVLLFLVQGSQCLRKWFFKIENQRLSMNIGWWIFLFNIFTVLFFLVFKHLFILFLFFYIVELSINRIIVVCLPIFLHDLIIFGLFLSSQLFLIILLIISCYNIKLFLMVINQILLSFLWNL